MLYSYRYRFLFVHLAKTGGTSVRTALDRYRWRDPMFYPQIICRRLSDLTRRRMGVRIPRHAKAITAQEMLPKDLFESLFKFAFVRNPWDLQVSSWYHIARERPHLVAGIDDFESFLHWKFDDPERPYHYIVDASTEPQWHSLMDFNGSRIVDFVGHYETLVDDYHEACRRIGLKRPPELPHKRKAEGRSDYRAYYTDRAAEIIDRHFRIDIDNLGYTFD
ncbi:MAG TPA: sulfotransferase family 2 domain-containing protein [Gammaproteobacteria bacterium]|nr:sulfotransferase family 2 domain-containing protein [Gammaproteobacteria bacterium]